MDFESFFFTNRKLLTLILGGLILIGIGIISYKSSDLFKSSKVEILESSSPVILTPVSIKELVVEISGAVQNPGVYKLKENSRIDDLLIAASGLSVKADRDWVTKNINRAAKLIDGQKVYIKSVGENTDTEKSNINSADNAVNIAGVSDVSGLININTATLKELDSLPGIGPVYAQNIIEGRIYSTVSELLSKKVLNSYTYEKIKDKVRVN